MNVINFITVLASDNMQPDGRGIKICSALPFVSTIVLIVKEKQLFKNIQDNYYPTDQISLKLAEKIC